MGKAYLDGYLDEIVLLTELFLALGAMYFSSLHYWKVSMAFIVVQLIIGLVYFELKRDGE